MKNRISRLVAMTALLAAPAVGQSTIDSSTFGGQIDRAVVLGGRMAAARERFDELTTGAGIEALNPMLERSGQAPLELLTRGAWDESSETVGGSTGTWDKRGLSQLGMQPFLRLR